MDARSTKSLGRISGGCSNTSSASRSRRLKLEAAATMAELTYRAEALAKRQELEKQIEEIKWKKEMMDVEVELEAARKRFNAMNEYDEQWSEERYSIGQSDREHDQDVERWVESSTAANKGCDTAHSDFMSMAQPQLQQPCPQLQQQYEKMYEQPIQQQGCKSLQQMDLGIIQKDQPPKWQQDKLTHPPMTPEINQEIQQPWQHGSHQLQLQESQLWQHYGFFQQQIGPVMNYQENQQQGQHLLGLQVKSEQQPMQPNQLKQLQDQINAFSIISQNQKLAETYKEQTTHQVQMESQNTVKHENQDALLDVIKQQGDLTKLLYEAQLKATLPSRNLPTFDGEPLKYLSWLAAFKHAIEDKTSNYRERLSFLENFTTGQPNSLVRSCLLIDDPEKGYMKAMSLLEKRYGNKFRIQELIIKKVQEWPELKANDVKALEGFSLFLNEAVNSMGDPIINELNHATNMKAIALKMPYGLKEKWRSKVKNIEEIYKRTATFSDIVDFIDGQVQMMNHPLYGCTGKAQVTGIKQREQKRAFTIKTEESSASKRQCEFCHINGHTIDTCRKLAKTPYQDRIEFMRKNGLCFGCTKRAAHRAKDCTNKLRCHTCNGRHPTVLHRDKISQTSKNASSESGAPKSTSNDKHATKTNPNNGSNLQNSQFCGLTGADNSNVQILPVLIRSSESGITIKTNAMLDDCSDATFISDSLKGKLKIKGPKTTLSLQTITGHRSVKSEVLCGLEVMDLHGQNKIELPKSYSCPEIPASTAHALNNEDLKRWPYLTKVNLPKVEGEVSIIIGNNTPKALEPWEIIHSQEDGPFASRTLLGWLVHGASGQNDSGSVFAYRVKVDEVMNSQLKELYNMDFNERIIQDTPQKSMEDKKFMTAVSNSIKHENGHITIGLPLKDPNVVFPDNRPQAEQRLASLKRKMHKNEVFRKEYTTFMSNILNKGYAEEVPEEEPTSHGKVWYLPHHGVYHPRKNKLRVVYDCAASYQTKALNHELLPGPNLTNNLVGVLSRFRKDSVALLADIEAMYHQVKVPLCDRNLLRFLWWPDGNINDSPHEFRMTSHVFGATSSPTIANYALQKTADNAQDHIGDIIKRNFYVDDCLFSTSTEAEAINIVKELTEVCGRSGFRLTKWASNHRGVLLTIPETERAKDVKNIDLSQDQLPAERALGLLWSPEADSFGFQIAMKNNPPTRRGILSTVSSFFDPLGIISPVLLPAKRLLQDLTRLEINWDDKIPEIHEKKWNQWITNIPDIASFSIPRSFVPLNFGTPISVQLHHFSDASEIGYGTVSYIRCVNQQQDIHCSLIKGKSR